MSRSHRAALANSRERARGRRSWIISIAAVAAVIAGVLVWRGTEHVSTPIPRAVQVQHRFVGTVAILNGTQGGCVTPLHGGSQACGLFLVLPGQPWPRVGQRVNVAVIVIPSNDDSAYPTILIYPDHVPANA